MAHKHWRRNILLISRSSQRLILPRSSAGGHGAAREICELVLDSQGKLEELYRQYL